MITLHFHLRPQYKYELFHIKLHVIPSIFPTYPEKQDSLRYQGGSNISANNPFFQKSPIGRLTPNEKTLNSIIVCLIFLRIYGTNPERTSPYNKSRGQVPSFERAIFATKSNRRANWLELLGQVLATCY